MRPVTVHALALSMVLLAVPATPAGGWYASAFIGYDFADDVKLDVPAGELSLSPEDNLVWSVGFGYQFKHIRLDAEVNTSRDHDIEGVSINGVPLLAPIGEVSTEAGIANVIYDFRRSSKVSPFLGLGVGVADLELNQVGANATLIVNDEDIVLCYQALAGLGVNLTDHWILDFTVRYYATEEGDFPLLTSGETTQADFSSFSATAGFRYDF